MPYLLSNKSCGLLTLLDENGRLVTYSHGVPVVSSKHMLKYVGRYLENLGVCDDNGKPVVAAPVDPTVRMPVSAPIKQDAPVQKPVPAPAPAPVVEKEEDPAKPFPEVKVDSLGLPVIPTAPVSQPPAPPKNKGGRKKGWNKPAQTTESSQV